MTITTTTLDTADNNFVLGETLRPLLTHAMGSAVEVTESRPPRAPATCRATSGRSTPTRWPAR